MMKKNIPLARFSKIMCKLRFAALCLPAGRALMTPLNMAMCDTPLDIGCERSQKCMKVSAIGSNSSKTLAQDRRVFIRFLPRWWITMAIAMHAKFGPVEFGFC